MGHRTRVVWRARSLATGVLASAGAGTSPASGSGPAPCPGADPSAAPRVSPARTSAVFSALFAGSESASFWLDSAAPHPTLGRLSVLGDTVGPFGAVHEFRRSADEGGVDRAFSAGGGGIDEGTEFWPRLRELLSSTERPITSDDGGAAPALPSGFEPGLVVALGYELGAPGPAPTDDHAPAGNSALAGVPDAIALVPSRLVVVDHYTGEAVALCADVEAAGADSAPEALTDTAAAPTGSAATEWLALAARAWAEADGAAGTLRRDVTTDGDAPRASGQTGGTFRLRHSEEEYLWAISAIKDAIAHGEAYEVCLTNSAHGPAPTDALGAYGRLRRHSPAPFAAFLRAGGEQEQRSWALLGASPERFLRVDAGGGVETRPIKGTRPRGTDPEADAALRDELAGNAKDRAENLMIVDLLRNDLGRVCAPGTIGVPQLCAVETYAHVHQLVSAVEGLLAPGRDAVDALAATFPGGSMTGAPKRRAMDLCAELEGAPRGLYSGAVGWLGASGTADLAITIRSAVVCGGRASIGIGGAILADSDPAAEFAETMVKLRPVLDALGGEFEGQG